ncbi:MULTISPECIES: DNA topoisomerase IB [unclassified Salinicola]|uniref:DNA topoisomerase IB n=1 Tax=unclassified Salinicola TaxID=2634022 RepID=UPI001A8FA944|nr:MULTISPECIES: DNA topoisomerase IB [unclassified Salinicola]MCE3027317.1 DNA topoisomerase IB [Salinicola sp. DM10]WIX33969.1 DNA topoisomerase IB [Salinicola sp. JS01]
MPSSTPRRVTRHRCGKGFTYRTPDGTTLKDERWREWIAGLAIPPAWREVEVFLDKRHRIHATGRDSAGRKQYVYNDAWREQRELEKFDRMVEFAGRLTRMRRVTGQHLTLDGMPREKVLACMVRLIDSAYFRPGSERYRQENDSYGLTTMRSKHLTIDGDELIFDYQGKSGQQQHRVVEDARLAAIVAELDDIPGYEIFKYFDDAGNKTRVDSHDLNDYIHEVMGERFSAKDFRTWAGTSIAALALDELGLGEDDQSSEKNVREAVTRVAERLGNTPSIAKASYIDPRVVESYLDGRTLSHFRQLVETEIEQEETLTSPDERAILELLRSRLKQEGA